MADEVQSKYIQKHASRTACDTFLWQPQHRRNLLEVFGFEGEPFFLGWLTGKLKGDGSSRGLPIFTNTRSHLTTL